MGIAFRRGYVTFFFLRGTHEITGLIWFPIWMLMSIVAFKDSKLLLKKTV